MVGGFGDAAVDEDPRLSDLGGVEAFNLGGAYPSEEAKGEIRDHRRAALDGLLEQRLYLTDCQDTARGLADPGARNVQGGVGHGVPFGDGPAEEGREMAYDMVARDPLTLADELIDVTGLD